MLPPHARAARTQPIKTYQIKCARWTRAVGASMATLATFMGLGRGSAERRAEACLYVDREHFDGSCAVMRSGASIAAVT